MLLPSEIFVCDRPLIISPASNEKPPMKSHLITSLLVLALSFTVASAATVSITVNSNNGPCYTTSTGALLAPGSVIRVGYFDLSNPVVLSMLQTSNDYAMINSMFTPLAEGVTNAGSILQTGAPGNNIVINDSFSNIGHVFGQITGIDSTYLPTGVDLSVWVFNSATPTNATEWGIFSASTGWEFPAALGSQTLATLEVDTYVRGSFDNTNQHIQLSPVSVVPEPSSLLLLLSVAIVARRRRR
jgi:hypothetical protein